MSMTPVPISIRFVRTPIAASSGNGADRWREKWCTRTNAPSIPISSAAIESSTVCRRASAGLFVSPLLGCQAPNERKPILFGWLIGRPRYAVARGLRGTRRPFPEWDVVQPEGECERHGHDRRRREEDGVKRHGRFHVQRMELSTKKPPSVERRDEQDEEECREDQAPPVRRHGRLRCDLTCNV